MQRGSLEREGLASEEDEVYEVRLCSPCPVQAVHRKY